MPDVVISLGIGQCPSKGVATVMTGPDGQYAFSGLKAGAYCVWASTTNPHPPAEGNPGVWTTPRTDDGQGVGWKTVTLDFGEQREGVDFGWDPLEQPSLGRSEAKGDQGSTCTDAAIFIKDVTVPDRMRIAPGESFEKVWRLKNTGTCSWTEDYSIVFSAGNTLNASTVSLFSYVVPPGTTTDLEIGMQAPKSQGSYKGYWMLRNASNQLFGIGEKADKPFWVEIVVETKPDRNYVESWEYVLDPAELAGEGRWIDVDVTRQRLTAYEGVTPIKSFMVSTGTSAYPTVLGQFRIWIKLEATDMSGPGYHLEDVPYTMYFYQGYGLHGAYWHNNFGTPMSHGCVNLETSNAAWLFDFAVVGTLVNIHP
jgi:hypothetical protein